MGRQESGNNFAASSADMVDGAPESEVTTILPAVLISEPTDRRMRPIDFRISRERLGDNEVYVLQQGLLRELLVDYRMPFVDEREFTIMSLLANRHIGPLAPVEMAQMGMLPPERLEAPDAVFLRDSRRALYQMAQWINQAFFYELVTLNHSSVTEWSSTDIESIQSAGIAPNARVTIELAAEQLPKKTQAEISAHSILGLGRIVRPAIIAALNDGREMGVVPELDLSEVLRQRAAGFPSQTQQSRTY